MLEEGLLIGLLGGWGNRHSGGHRVWHGAAGVGVTVHGGWVLGGHHMVRLLLLRGYKLRLLLLEGRWRRVLLEVRDRRVVAVAGQDASVAAGNASVAGTVAHVVLAGHGCLSLVVERCTL